MTDSQLDIDFLRLLQDSTDVNHKALHKQFMDGANPALLLHARQSVLEAVGKPTTHLCDAFKWLTLDGRVTFVTDVQVLIGLYGVYMTATVEVTQEAGRVEMEHVPIHLAESPALLAFA